MQIPGRITRFLFLILATQVFLACEPEKEEVIVEVPVEKDPFEGQETGKIKIYFENEFNGKALIEGDTIVTPLNDTLKIEFIKFFVSNFTAKDEQGNSAVPPKEYHLIRPETFTEEGKTSIEFELPARKFERLTFAVGVDPEKNCCLDNSIADLQPVFGMSWDWNTGYKFLSVEGKHIQQADPSRPLTYHIGGDANYKLVTLDFDDDMGELLSIEKDKTSEITVVLEASKIFVDPFDIDVDSVNVAMGGPNASLIANNYARNAFSCKSLINP